MLQILQKISCFAHCRGKGILLQAMKINKNYRVTGQSRTSDDICISIFQLNSFLSKSIQHKAIQTWTVNNYKEKLNINFSVSNFNCN